MFMPQHPLMLMQLIMVRRIKEISQYPHTLTWKGTREVSFLKMVVAILCPTAGTTLSLQPHQLPLMSPLSLVPIPRLKTLDVRGL